MSKRWNRLFSAIGGKEISPSMVSTYLRCPMQWYWRYVEHKIVPPGIALVQGSAVHSGAGADMENALENGEHLKPDMVVDIAVAEYEQRIKDEDVLLTPDEQSRGKDIVIGEAKDQTGSMAKTYAEKAKPLVPKKVEVWLEGTLTTEEGDSVRIVGRPDFILDPKSIKADETVGGVNPDSILSEDGIIGDLKTAGSKWQKSKIENSIQFITYAMLDGGPSAATLFQVIKGKRSTKAHISLVGYNKEQYQRVQRLMIRVLDSIEAGIFPPTDPTNWACSPAYCGYWSMCPFGGGSGKKEI